MLTSLLTMNSNRSRIFFSFKNFPFGEKFQKQYAFPLVILLIYYQHSPANVYSHCLLAERDFHVQSKAIASLV